MPVYDVDVMKRFVLENCKPGSPLREIILQDKGGDVSHEVMHAKGTIWFQLMRLEEKIEYRLKDENKRR